VRTRHLSKIPLALGSILLTAVSGDRDDPNQVRMRFQKEDRVRIVRRASITLAFICTLLIAVSARAQTGTIAGVLVQEGTLTPLAADDNNFYAVQVMPVGGTSPSASGSTNASGAYSISGLTPGSYYVKAIATGHVDELHNNVACIAEDCPMTAGTPVVVTASAVTTVDFALAPGGRISGTVRRAADGSAVGQVQVRIYNASTSVIGSRLTAADGTYAFPELTTGSYFARVLGSGFTTVDYIHELYGGVQCPHLAPASDCRIASGTPIAVTVGATTAGIDFSLDNGARISGRVIAEGAGTPLADVNVRAYQGDVMMGGATTDTSGQFTIVGLPAGRFRIRTEAAPANYVDEWQNGVCVGCAGAAATLTVTAAQVMTGVDFSLATGGTIAGTAVCGPGPTVVDLEQGPTIAVFSSTGEFVRSGVTGTSCGATNTYTVGGLPTGTYFLWARGTPRAPFGSEAPGAAYIDQLYGGTLCNTVDCDVRKGVPVSVTAGATTSGIDFIIQFGGGFGLLHGLPPLTIFDSRGIEVINAIGRSNPLGILDQHVVGLPPGTYYLTAGNLLNGGSTCVDCPPTAGVPIVVARGGNSSQPTFTTPTRRVSGTITAVSGGAPLSTVTVELVSSSGKVVGSALSDFLGHYTVTALGAGTYFARTVNDRGFLDEVYADAACGTCDPRVGAPILVSSSDITGIDFALAQGGVLSGLVSDTAGIVLNKVPVSVFAGTTTFAGVKTSSASGRYRLTVPAGTFRALAEASTNKGSEVYSEMPCTSAGCDPATGTAIGVTAGTITSGIDFTLMSCSTMTVSPSIVATGVVGSAYRQVFSPTGGTGPFVFDVTEGALPLGLAVNATTGVLSGTPTVAGRSTFRVSALDANGCATDRSYVLDVQACAFTLSPASATLAATGGNVAITIANACGAQDVVESSDWISVQSNTPGQVTLTIAASTQTAARIASVAIGRRLFEVRQAGTSSQAPYGLLDLPIQGAQVSGAVAIGGWALDDVEVSRVRIYRDGVLGEPFGPVFVGTAVFIPGARPDVQLVAPGIPHNDRAGFGFLMLTNTLPNQGNGTFRIYAIAEDAEGHSTLLGSRTIVVDNATAELPFGTLDTPGQGQTISGSSFTNFGWALTPRPAMIPMDGSTIQVIVDGVPIGTADYNHFRPDVSNTFPGLANSGGPVGFRAFDTTALSEGLHTISWSVTDSRPATAGLGSRYFVVANSADAPAPVGSVTSTQQTDVEPTEVAKPLGAAPAPDSGRRAESLAVAADREPTRARRLTLAPMERLELVLDQLLGEGEEACPATWAGYLSKDNVLGDLPVGASLDPAGTFYWQTGPGFAGRFPLVFVRTNCRGEKQPVPLIVTIPIK
jgi:hypothetical protein